MRRRMLRIPPPRVTHFSWPIFLALLAVAGSASTAAAIPRETQATETEISPAEPLEAGETAVIEEILRLERRIEKLVRQLSPEARAQLESRLEELRRAQHETPGEARPAAAEPEPGPEAGTGASPPEARPTDGERAAEPAVTAVRSEEAVAAPRCRPLLPFDSTGDGVLAATDRSWRFFAVWLDHDRDGSPEDRELQHPFELGIVEISLDLRSFRTRDDFTGDIHREDGFHLGPLGRGSSSGLLLVDATRLREGGGPLLLDRDGLELEGLQVLRPGLQLRDETGAVTPLDCP